jgi:hypothetical protein
MIRFRCPNCTQVLKATEDAANTKVCCARCGQRIRVPDPNSPPPPPSDKTMLGDLDDEPEPAAFSAAAAAAPPPVPQPPAPQLVTYVPSQDPALRPAIPGASPLGRASFLIGLITVAVDACVWVIAIAVVSTSRPRHWYDVAPAGPYTLLWMAAASTCLGWIAGVTGLTLGIVALTQPYQRQGLAIAGTVINVVIVAGLLFLALLTR